VKIINRKNLCEIENIYVVIRALLLTNLNSWRRFVGNYNDMKMTVQTEKDLEMLQGKFVLQLNTNDKDLAYLLEHGYNLQTELC